MVASGLGRSWPRQGMAEAGSSINAIPKKRNKQMNNKGK
jgi:hypothetical protein